MAFLQAGSNVIVTSNKQKESGKGFPKECAEYFANHNPFRPCVGAGWVVMCVRGVCEPLTQRLGRQVASAESLLHLADASYKLKERVV